MDEAAGYSGILLANSVAKIAHAWARERLLPTLQNRRTIGQSGGLPSQQRVTGVQIVGQIKSMSTATLFLDLRSAFHHMLRELVLTTNNSLLSNTLSMFLDENEFDGHQIRKGSQRVVFQTQTR